MPWSAQWWMEHLEGEAAGPRMSVPFVLGGSFSFSFGWVGEGGIAGTYAVVKGCAGEVGAVPESVPLSAALRVEVVEIVVGEVLGERLDVVLEGFTAECRCTGYVEGEAGCDEAGQVRGIGEGLERFPSHLTDTISPLCISFAAAATRFGVRRLSRPSLPDFLSVNFLSTIMFRVYIYHQLT